MANAADAKLIHFVESLPPATTVFALSNRLTETGAPAIAITQEGRIVGIVSQSTIIDKIVIEEKDPKQLLAQDIMSEPQMYAQETVPIKDLLWLMKHKQLDYLPVTNDKGYFVKLLSLTDVLSRYNEELIADCRDLEAMIVADAKGG